MLAQLRATAMTQGSSASPELPAAIELIAAAVAFADGDPAAAQHHAAAATAGVLSSNPNSRAAAAVFGVRARLWLGDVAGARALLPDARRRAQASAVVSSGLLNEVEGALCLAEGRVTEALTLAHRSAHRLEISGSGDLGGAGCRLLRGAATVELGEPEDAAGHLAAAAEATAKDDHVGLMTLCGIAQARRLSVTRHLPESLDQLRTVGELLDGRAPDGGLRHRVRAAETDVRLVAGDVVRAEALLHSALDSVPNRLRRVRLGQLRRPGSGLRALRSVAVTDVRTAVERDVLMGAALFEADRSAAERRFLSAGDLSQEHGLGLALLGMPGDVLEFVAGVARRRGHDGLLGLVQAASRPAPATATASPRLSRGEMQLLAMLPGRDNNADIAATLSVSVNTVKTRLRRLYAKLGVSRRKDAVDVGRRLGLLQ